MSKQDQDATMTDESSNTTPTPFTLKRVRSKETITPRKSKSRKSVGAMVLKETEKGENVSKQTQKP